MQPARILNRYVVPSLHAGRFFSSITPRFQSVSTTGINSGSTKPFPESVQIPKTLVKDSTIPAETISAPVQIEGPSWTARVFFECSGRGELTNYVGPGSHLRSQFPSESVTKWGHNYVFSIWKGTIIYWKFDGWQEDTDYVTLRIDGSSVPSGRGQLAVSTTNAGIRVYTVSDKNVLVEYALNEDNDKKWFKGELTTDNNFKCHENTVLCAVGDPISIAFNQDSMTSFSLAYWDEKKNTWRQQGLKWATPAAK